MHHHGLAPASLARIAAEPERYGARLTHEEGGVVRVGFCDGKEVRVPPAWTELEARRAHLNDQGCDGAVLSTQIDFHRYTLPAEEGVRLAEVLNDGMAEWVQGRPDFKGMATLPLQDGPAAARVLARAKEQGLVGAMIMTHVGPRNLDDPGLEPVWEAAEELAMPIFVHPGDVLGRDRLSCYYLTNLLGNPFETTVAASHLILGGVLDRHPGLVVVLAHGGGYLSLAYGRLTHGVGHVANVAFPAAAPPKAYLRRFYYDTILYEQELLRNLMHLVGADRILLGSDYPFDMEPDRFVDFVRTLPASEAEREAILTNAARLYGFPASPYAAGS
jgi:aminocarboxymuconate-semialdehyde decarboxylase